MVATRPPSSPWGRIRLFTLLVALSPPLWEASGQALHVGPLLNSAHSHNDYEQKRPLAEALENGFRSVEADIHLVDHRLLVAHDLGQTTPERTLERLYLEPLWRIYRETGRIHPGGVDLILLVDIKSNAESTYAALRSDLARHAPMLTRVENGKLVRGAVMVILSGNRPLATLARETDRLCFIDGRPENLGNQLPTEFMPLISSSWRSHFQWRGTGTMPEEERAELRRMVRAVHAEGKLLRFWATPDDAAGWGVLRAEGVDLLNTDQPTALRKFLSENP